MLLRLDQVLTDGELAAAAEILAADDVFVDGGATASGAAREVKANEQARPGPRAEALIRLARDALLRHQTFQAFAQPKAFARVLVSRYRPGMAYGAHVDAAIMRDRRVDLSFTLFLSAPSAYEGGALVIEGVDGDTAVKLEAGQAVVYDAGAVHRVEPVTRGERLAVVGWITSRVRRPDQRAALFDLELALANLPREPANDAVRLRLSKLRYDLVRMWAED